MILHGNFQAAFRKHRSKSFPELHFYVLKDVQEPEMRRQMTDPPFLFWGKEDLIAIRMGKNCTAQQWRKPFKRSSLLPWQNLSCTACPTQSISEGAVAAQHSSQESSLAHWEVCSLLSRNKRASAIHKMWTEDSFAVIPLADKASWVHPFDRPSFSAYHAKSKNRLWTEGRVPFQISLC